MGPLETEWTYPPPPNPPWSTYLGPLTVGLWITVLILWFFSGVLWSRIWILAAYVDIGVRAIAVLATVVWAASLIRHRRWFKSIAVTAVAAGIAALVMLDVWVEVYPRVWFWAGRSSFVAAERLARAGSLDGDIHEYYGVPLPPDLAAISVDGKIGTTTAWTDDGELDELCGAGRLILFAPAWIGIPDGAVGFVHIPCDVPPGVVLDGFADDMCPNYPLADGWWWADGVSCDLTYR